MIAAPVTLENFDSGTELSEPQSQDYKRGYKDGLAEAESLVDSQLAKAISELTISLNDLAFTYEEARQQVLGKLSPLISQISDHVVPSLLANTFGLHLTDALKAAIEAECAEEFHILVSPENAKLFASTDLGASIPHEFLPNPDLNASQAIVSSGNAAQVLDLSALTDALRAALQGLDQSERSQING